MARSINIPPGFMTKQAAADFLGMSTKTLDRRRKTEQLLQDIMLKGKQVFIRQKAVEAYLQLSQERGYL